MQLRDIIKYKPKKGKPYYVTSVKTAYRNACMAHRLALHNIIGLGFACMGIAGALMSYRMDKKRREAAKETVDRVVEKFHEYKAENS